MKKEKFEIIILLCPGNPRIKENFQIEFPDLEIDQNTNKSIYVGGKIRIKAALYLWKKNKVKKFIVVGGSKHKVDCMKRYLQNYGILGKNIVRIESDPDTLGDLKAIWRVLKESRKLKKFISLAKQGKIALLTNDYHMERALLFARETFFKNKENNKFASIVAEDVVLKTDNSEKLIKPKEVF